MPAITVDDPTTLPRLEAPGLGDQPRPVWQVTTAPSGYEGEGFPVRRAFAGIDMALLDPFIMMDQMGEVDYAPGEPKGTPWHPHRGFETVTYIIDGVFDHQDSHGGGGSITNGDTQWMTAGAGILHIETPPEWLVQQGGLFHGIQLWVNLPSSDKLAEPAYQDIGSGQVQLLTSYDAGSLVRVIAGEVDGHRGPGSTHTPMSLVHATIEPGARLDLPWNNEFNALVYVLGGHGTVGVDGQPIDIGPGGRARQRRLPHHRRRGPAGEPDPAARRDRRRRPADPRAARLGRPVRDEHQGRGAGGVRGLPARPVRPHPRSVAARPRNVVRTPRHRRDLRPRQVALRGRGQARPHGRRPAGCARLRSARLTGCRLVHVAGWAFGRHHEDATDVRVRAPTATRPPSAVESGGEGFRSNRPHGGGGPRLLHTHGRPPPADRLGDGRLALG